jgi:hypothetical protein
VQSTVIQYGIVIPPNGIDGFRNKESEMTDALLIGFDGKGERAGRLVSLIYILEKSISWERDSNRNRLPGPVRGKIGMDIDL